MKLMKNSTSVISWSFYSLGTILMAAAIIGFRKGGPTSRLFWPYVEQISSLFSSAKVSTETIIKAAYPLSDNTITAWFLYSSIVLFVLSIYYGFRAKKQKENSLYYAAPMTLSMVTMVLSVPYLLYFIQHIKVT